MKLYAKRSDGVYCVMEGMTEDQINGMMAEMGLTCEFLTKETFELEQPRAGDQNA